MNSLQLYLAIGFGVVGVIVLAVIWSIRRMPSEAELEQQHLWLCEEAVRRGASAEASLVEQARANPGDGDR